MTGDDDVAWVNVNARAGTTTQSSPAMRKETVFVTNSGGKMKRYAPVFGAVWVLYKYSPT